MDGTDMMDESGQEDNLLSLNPNDPDIKPVVEKWQDGGRYKFTFEGDQITPGKFKLDPITFSASAVSAEVETPEEDAATGEEPEAVASSARGATGNPAVDRMIGDY